MSGRYRGVMFQPGTDRCHTSWRPDSDMRCAHLPELHDLETGACSVFGCECGQFRSARTGPTTIGRYPWWRPLRQMRQIRRDVTEIAARIEAMETTS